MLSRTGIYDIYEIIPQTVNSANNALYKIIVNGVLLDSIYLNQNEGSGSWKNIGRYFLSADTQILIRVIDSGESTAGPVIRADAFKVALFQETTSTNERFLSNAPNSFQLFQNYPNPFNPSTNFKFSIPKESKVILKVYDMLGREIETLVNEEKSIGTYELTWNAINLPSGVYFYRLKAGNYISTKKMIFMK